MVQGLTAVCTDTSTVAEGLVRQHVIDPELCTACMSCVMVCPRNAIEERGRVVAIDPAKCENCGDCITECSTGAIESWLIVRAGEEYSLEDQFNWKRLPPPELF